MRVILELRGRRGKGAYGKTNEFGIYKCNGRVCTQIVPNCSRASLQAVIKEKVNKDSVIHSYQCRGYNGLVDLGCNRHYHLDHEVGK